MTKLQLSKLVLIFMLLPTAALTYKPLAAGESIGHGCASLPNADHPSAVLSNDAVQAVVFLPDTKRGYYRASRFDWSGVVGCLSYQGHTFFGQWFPLYDPLLNDSITGPVEEFRSSDGALGYAAAKPGELFVKVGVGTLRKIDDTPYKFGITYPLVDSGQWKTRAKSDHISFQQQLSSPIGISYIYRKTLKLDKHDPVLVLEHSLKNTGSKTIDTEVYDHDFFMLDGKPTGPGMAIHFQFAPKAVEPLGSSATIEGNEIAYREELQPHQSFAGYLQGYSDKATDYDFTVEDRTTGVGVQQSADTPISRLYLWSIRTTVCPEAYIHLVVPPGKTAHWNIRYRFYAGKK